jgi:AraC-like DNA-binding protein
MAGETVAAGFVSGLLDYAASRGADRTLLAARAQLLPQEIEQPDRRVAFDKYILLIRAAKQACAEPALALHFGEAVDIRQMSIVALLGQSCQSPMEAFEAANRYASLDADLDTNGGDRFRLDRRAGQLWLVDTRVDPNASPEVTESSFARMVSAVRHMGLQLPLRQVHVTHPKPDYHAEYSRIFGVPVVFEAEWNALQIDGAILSQTIALQPLLAGRILTDRADSLLKELQDTRPFQRVVEAVLRPLLAAGTANGKAVAAKLGVSRQTLYRRLKGEGLTYERVLDGLRHRLAEDALSTGRLSVSEIAYRIGFADQSSFTKAFKRWTGTTPGGLRRRRGRPGLET